MTEAWSTVINHRKWVIVGNFGLEVGGVMTRREIVKKVTEKTGLSQLQAKVAVQETLSAMIDHLVKDGRLELRNFGVFEIHTRKERIARNPRTGEKVMVPERKVVTFKPGKLMGERIRKIQ